MKILLFITSYRQMEEYKYFQLFLQQCPKLSELCDIFVYCNNPAISSDLVHYFHQFQQINKQLFITNRNAGYRVGGVEAVSQAMDMGIFQSYDFVIHLHADVFITEESALFNLLQEHVSTEKVFLVTKAFPFPTWYAFDFFIFKPKYLTFNIFKEELYSFTESPEEYLFRMLQKNNISHQVVKRYDNDCWNPRRVDDHLKLYHEHDLEKVHTLLHNQHVIQNV